MYVAACMCEIVCGFECVHVHIYMHRCVSVYGDSPEDLCDGAQPEQP
jgi:hypothetical protein